MADGILHTYIPNRVIDSNGIADGSEIAFYLTGTMTPASIYTADDLGTTLANPVVVGAGAAVPNIYLDPDVVYRRIVTYSDGSTQDTDPYTGLTSTALSFVQAGDNAETRAVQAKLREFISVLDYGADPTGATNSTTAIQRAMKYGMDAFDGDDDFYIEGPGEPAAGAATQFERRDRRTIRIYFPQGLYLVSPEVFSSLTHARDAYVGFAFFGAGAKSSILKLVTGGAEAWFYKTSSGQERYQGMAFRDLGFTSDNYLYANFAKVYSTGGPKQFNIERCLFRDMQTFMHTEGTGNADLNRVTNSWIEHYGPLLILNNDQSVEHDFLGVHLRSWAPHVDVRQHGGGSVHFANGACDLLWDERISPSTGTYFFTHSSDASIAAGNCTYSWRDMRVEVEAYALRPHVRASTNSAGYAIGVGTVTLASSGTGAIAIGDKVRFDTTDRTIYTVTSGDADVSNGGSISFTPTLVQAIPAANTTIFTNEPPLGIVKTVSNTNANPRILLDNIEFVSGQTRVIDEDGTVTGDPAGEFRRLFAFQMWPRKHVEIRGGVGLKNFFFNFDGSRTTDGPNGGGIVKISGGYYDGINGELPTGDSSLNNIHSRASYGGSAGRLITTGLAFDHTTGTSNVSRIQDADPRWTSRFGAEQPSKKKVCHFKHINNGWPSATSAASVNGGIDHFVDIPPGIMALRIYVKKLAVGASTDAYQLHIKTTDRSGTILGSSTLAQFKDEHVIDLSHVDLTGITRICLCASGAWDSFSAPAVAIAYIEYV
jgi:hypothetical protein